VHGRVPGLSQKARLPQSFTSARGSTLSPPPPPPFFRPFLPAEPEPSGRSSGATLWPALAAS